MHAKYCMVGDVKDRMQEECAELIHALSKVKRFGWIGHEDKMATGVTNIDDVEAEIKDVEYVLAELKREILDKRITERVVTITDENHEHYLSEVSVLMENDPELGTEDGDALDYLATIIEKYEKLAFLHLL